MALATSRPRSCASSTSGATEGAGAGRGRSHCAGWFVKDLQILKRSPLLVGLLIVYPIAIALMIGFALSSPPGKPTVAILNEVPPGQGTISFGSQKISISQYAKQLFDSITPLKVSSRDEAIAKVRCGQDRLRPVVPSGRPDRAS